jgi:F0F1-type ATP synthase assembly protein I
VNGPTDGGRWAAAGGLATLGLVIGLCVALGMAGGYWLDRKLGTAPVFGVIGLILGSAAALREVLRAVRLSRRDGSR